MFPYKDENPTLNTPVVTIAAVVITTAVWLLYQGAGIDPRITQSVCDLGAIPARVFGRELVPIMTERGPVLPCPNATGFGLHTVLTSVFLHGSWFHLIGNMWFLWIFGNNVEDVMGPGRFIGFYLVCGLLAALGQMMAQPGSPIPLVGASGAISGVMGAYLVLYPRVRVHNLLFLGFFVTTVALPAWVMLLYWAFLQLLGSAPALAGYGSGGGVAFLAHLSGFVVGAVLIRFFARPELVVAHRHFRESRRLGWTR